MAAKSSSALVCAGLWLLTSAALTQDVRLGIRLNIDLPNITTDKSVTCDYDIVNVCGLRRTDGKEARWAEFSRPHMMELGAGLMLLHPDRSVSP